MSTSDRPSLAELASPAVLPDPYPLLAALRAASPYAEFDGALVVVARHADIAAVLRHPGASSQRGTSLLAAAAARRAPRQASFLSLDPPDHTRLRRLVSRAFTARTVARLEPRIRAVTRELLAAIEPGSDLEVVSQLAYPLPVRIISELLGVPGRRPDQVRRLVGPAGHQPAARLRPAGRGPAGQGGGSRHGQRRVRGVLPRADRHPPEPAR